MVKNKVTKWTELEDFYLKENVMNFEDKELAKKLGKTEKQVANRLKTLGIDVVQLVKEAKRKNALKGLAVGTAGNPDAGVVAMTGQRSMSDDLNAKKKQNTKYASDRVAELEKELSDLKESDKDIPPKPTLIDQFKVK